MNNNKYFKLEHVLGSSAYSPKTKMDSVVAFHYKDAKKFEDYLLINNLKGYDSSYIIYSSEYSGTWFIEFRDLVGRYLWWSYKHA